MKTIRGRLIVSTIVTFVGCLFLSHYSVRAQTSEEQTIDTNLSTVFLGGKEDDPYEAFHRPSGVEIDGEGNFYVLDSGNGRIVKFDSVGTFLREIGRTGVGLGEFRRPVDLTFDKEGNIYVLDVDISSFKVKIMDKDGKHLNSFDVSATYQDCGSRIAVDDQGLIYLNLPMEGALFSVYTKEGQKVTSFGEITYYENTTKNIVFNTVMFFVDERNFLISLDYAKPILRQYDRNHRLVFQKEIKSPEIEVINESAAKLWERIKETEINRKKGVSYISYFIDVILIDDGDILALLSTWSTFNRLDLEGNVRTRINLKKPYEPKKASIRRISMDAKGSLYALNSDNAIVFKYEQFLKD